MAEQIKKTIVMATRNRGKVRELQAMLASLPVYLLDLATVEKMVAQSAPAIEETGNTFYENALLKAQGYAAWSGFPVIAEDSGLEVDALAGAPGVLSSRYSGQAGNDQANNQKLLLAMKNIPWEKRTASFCTVAIYLAAPMQVPIVAQGRWHGHIAWALSGEHGFGYDPLFWLEAHQCTSAQLLPEVKNKISHRGQAIDDLIGRLAAVL